MRFSIVTLLALSATVSAGPLANGICQTGCDALIVACYAGSSNIKLSLTYSVLSYGTELFSFRILECRAMIGVCRAECDIAMLNIFNVKK
jgi:hypothetical protein